MRKALDDLIARDDPAWPLVTGWAVQADANPNILLPPDRAQRDASLLALQVTTRSTLGAVAYESGGMTFHDGWLRLLGSGQAEHARSLLRWNEQAGAMRQGDASDWLLIADDVLGGFFALNGGRFGQDTLGQVFHLAPDGLDWACLDLGYTDFVHWCFFGQMPDFYADLDGLGCWDERSRPGFDQAFAFYPFLWSREGKDHAKVSRRAVDISEVWGLKIEVVGEPTRSTS